jgi:polar amino acid transport system substrate-binding protein
MCLADIRHCVRVANFSMTLADALSLSHIEKEELYISGLFHDIGKAFLRQDILNKPGRLTITERKHIETHPVFSYQEAKNVGFSDAIANNILHHHENFDGTGYPDRIKGHQIPLGARILKITDTFDALTSDRPYRKALAVPEVLVIMSNHTDHYDPELYLLFIHLVDKLTNNFHVDDFQRLSAGGGMV